MDSVSIETPSLIDFFNRSALRFPDRRALFAGGAFWTYDRLNTESARIEKILQSVGIGGRQSNVGVLYASSPFSYAALIAIMKAGNVYVPLNPKAPAHRLLRIVKDACLEAVIVDRSDAVASEFVDALVRPGSQFVLRRNAGAEAFVEILSRNAHRELRSASQERGCDVSRCVSADASGLAYIIYTSGSTGAPKGVAITHAAVCGCIEKLHSMFATGCEDRFTQFSALSFDVSIADMFLCWKSAGTLFVPSPSELLVPFGFAVQHRLTVWSSVPSIANFMMKLRILKPDALPDLRLSLFAGEALPAELAHAWSRAAPRSRIFNLYGPTECTIFATCFEYGGQPEEGCGVVPIGEPLPELRARIVDQDRIVDTEDMAGELWLSGDQLAAGYWGDGAATAAAFVRPDPQEPQSIWYRTGDLVSYRRGVGLSFRGRLDRQIKLRGFRVELQEIESVLRDVMGGAAVAVVPVRGRGGICEKIVAYCQEATLDETVVKARCLDRLPAYMVPERIHSLDALPLNENGKVDYLALAALSE